MLEGQPLNLTVTQGNQEPREVVLDQFVKLPILHPMLKSRGEITRPSHVQLNSKVERPLFTRARRAELLETFLQNRRRHGTLGHDLNEELITHAHALDSITEQYLNRGYMQVEINGLGTQIAPYTTICAPDSVRRPEHANKPPILVVPGISNDLEGVGNLLAEIALTGRDVMCVAYPESRDGSVTAEFAKHVGISEGYGPHAAFFKSAIDYLYDGTAAEVWAYSAGCGIMAEILNDKQYQEQVEQAVMICPTNIVRKSQLMEYAAVGLETKYLLQKGHMGHYVFADGLARPNDLDDSYNRDAFENLTEQVLKKNEDWKTARVKDGGRIVYVVCENDSMTSSFRGRNRLRNHPQGHVLELPGYHTTPIAEAPRVVKAITAAQNLPAAA